MKQVDLSISEPSVSEPPFGNLELEVDRYFNLPKSYAEEIGKCVTDLALTQYDLDKLIHEHSSKEEAHPGIRGEIKSAILSDDREELTRLGHIASRLAERGAELKEFRKAAKKQMESNKKDTFHK